MCKTQDIHKMQGFGRVRPGHSWKICQFSFENCSSCRVFLAYGGQNQSKVVQGRNSGKPLMRLLVSQGHQGAGIVQSSR